MQEKKPRRGIQSVEIAFRILSVMQGSQQADERCEQLSRQPSEDQTCRRG